MTNNRDLTGHQGLADPRLLDGSATDFESSLLRAAVEEAPGEALKAQMLAPLATGAATTAAATTGSLGVLKWVVSGAGVLLVGGAYYLGDAPVEAPLNSRKSAPAAEVPPKPPTREAKELTPELPASPESLPPREERKTDTHAPIVAARPSKKSASSLADEMRLLDEARTALKSRKDPNEALRLLRVYDSRYPSGALRPEATVLRVSALEESGAGDRADALKSEFLKAHPQSAHKKQLENGASSAK